MAPTNAGFQTETLPTVAVFEPENTAVISLDLGPLRNTLPHLGPLLAVIAAITVFYSEALGTPLSLQAMPTNEDVVNTFRPVLLEQFEHVQQFGDMLRWTDRRGLGQHQLLNPQYGTTYPPRWLALRLISRAEEAADWLFWGHAVVAALAVMALARYYRISPWSAALAGILFTLGHLPVRWIPLFHAPIHFATYPLSILGTELIWSGRGRLGVPLTALSLGASGIGSHLQSTHMVTQAVIILTVCRIVTVDVPFRERQRRLLLSIVALALGLIIMAPTVVPFVFEQDNSTRQELVREFTVGMNHDSLLSHVDPDAGSINDSVYMGPLLPILALVGLAVSIRSKRLAFLPLLLVLALLVGFKTPLLEVLWHLVPGWSVLSNVQRASFITVLPLAMLAALGADWLADPQRRKSTVVAVAAVGTMSLVYWLLRLRELGQAPSFEFWQASVQALILAVVLHLFGTRRDRNSRGLSFPLVGLAFILSFLTLWEGRTIMGWRPVADAPPPQYRDMLSLVRAQNDQDGRWMSFALDYDQAKPNAFLESPGRWLDTYDSFVTKEFFTYWRTLTGVKRYDRPPPWLGGLWYQHLGGDPAPHPNLVNAAGISRVLASDSRVAEAHALGWKVLARRGDLLVYDNPNAFPMAYLSRRWESVPGDISAAIARLAAVGDVTFRSHTDYITGTVEVASPDDSPLPVQMMRLGTEEVRISVREAVQSPGIAVLLDSHHPDWRAYVHGAPRPLLRINGVFRGVLLQPGETRATFRYEPRWVPRLQAIAGILAVLLSLLFLPVRWWRWLRVRVWVWGLLFYNRSVRVTELMITRISAMSRWDQSVG